jgi:Protein of unknown function (DUF2723)
VPFALYALTASGHSYWLDSGEFVAASVQLDIAHPPGHPLSLLYGKLWSLLPMGSMPWRLALGQAFAGALAALFACLAIHRAMARLKLAEHIAWSLAVSGAWLPAFTYGLWFQAVRPEVYALQTLCMAIAMERCTRLDATSPPSLDTRALYAVALALGLGLANHHLIALLVAPAFVPAALRVARERGVRPLLLGCAFAAVALGVYAYLPVRAQVPPPINLGNPSTWENFWWVLSAKVYTKNLAFLTAGSPTERGIDMLVLLLQNVQGPVLTAAVVGMYLSLRHPLTRRAGTMFGAVFVIDVGFRAWMGSVLGNPDILGYLGPAFIALGALAALAVAVVLSQVLERLPRAQLLGLAVAALAPLVALSQAKAAWPRASLAGFAATDVFDDVRMRALAPRAVLVSGTAQTTFRFFELEAVEAVRPDVTQVPVSFLGYPGTAERLKERAPDVKDVVERAMKHGHFPGTVAQELTKQRPVYAEVEARTQVHAYARLVPEGHFHRFEGADAALPSIEERAASLQRDYASLYAALGRDAQETETVKQLLWMHYLDALYFAAQGARPQARESLRRALALEPRDVELQAFSTVLADLRRAGAIDIEPFLHRRLTGR